MKLQALGHRLIVKPVEVKQNLNKDVPSGLLDKGFTIHVDSDTERRHFEGTMEGEVVAIGPMAWKQKDLGYGSVEWAPWVQVGDRITFVQYAKTTVTDPETQEKYFILNDVDVLARVGA